LVTAIAALPGLALIVLLRERICAVEGSRALQ
jgi:hypothetical protein